MKHHLVQTAAITITTLLRLQLFTVILQGPSVLCTGQINALNGNVLEITTPATFKSLMVALISPISLGIGSCLGLLFSYIRTIVLMFRHWVMSDSLWPHGLQHARLPCPSLSPGVCLNSCPLSRCCHTIISSSAIHLSSCSQSFPASESLPKLS